MEKWQEELKDKKFRIFVYGTLKKGESNHHFLSNAKYICDDVINGYELYDLPYGFPCIVKGKGDIYGEVYEVNIVDLFRVNALEGFREPFECVDNSLYDRDKVNPKISEEPAYVYVMKQVPNCGAIKLKDGMWNKLINISNYLTR